MAWSSAFYVRQRTVFVVLNVQTSLHSPLKELTMTQRKSPEHCFLNAFLAGAIAAGIGASPALAATGDSSAPQAKSDSMAAVITDTAITGGVKARLQSEAGLKKSKIEVTTTNGVVTLEGSASDSTAKTLAGNATESVAGVKSVDNSLKVLDQSKTRTAVDKTQRVVSDSWITTKVKSDLLADDLAKSFKIGVKTIRGVVVLSGALPNQTAVEHASAIAGKVNGVKSVDASTLTVAAKPMAS